MPEIVFDVTIVGVILVVAIMGSLSARIIVNRGVKTGSGTVKAVKENYDKILKSQGDYIEELEDSVKHYKNKASNMERGPKVEGDVNELDAILPELVAEFAPYAPKWLKPFLGNKDTQQWIIKYVKDNPDKAKEWFGKVVKSKTTTDQEAPQTETGL